MLMHIFLGEIREISFILFREAHSERFNLTGIQAVNITEYCESIVA